MRERILKTIRDHPKHYSQILKKDKEVYIEVTRNSGIDSDVFAEHLYSYLYQTGNVCDLGNRRKFKSFKEGFSFCGRANICECARKSVSESVKRSKENITAEQRLASSKKRKETNLERYGVENTGQTETAKKRHKELYQDEFSVSKLLASARETLKERYGVDNPRDIPGVSERIAGTLMDRYGVVNIAHIPGVTEKALSTKIEKYGDLSSLYLEKSFDRLVEKLLEIKIKILCERSTYTGVEETYDFECLVCNHKFSTTLNNGNIPQCRACNPVHGSVEQQEVFSFIQSIYSGVSVANDRTVLQSGKELDIWIPEKKIAIEYNGLYWHNETRVSRDYHYQKYSEAREKGIVLIQIFSDQWKNRKEIVKRYLQHKLGQTRSRIYARECKIVELSDSEAEDFFSKYHLQGYVRSKVRLGLEHHGKIVSGMLFSKPRLGIGKNQKGYELVRFASSENVVGGASKLLKHFERAYSPSEVYSFSDNTYSNGDLYRTLGFTEESFIPPGYSYVDKTFSERFHRFNFRKDKLKEAGLPVDILTEHQIMLELGYLRVYDAGKVKWIKGYNNE